MKDDHETEWLRGHARTGRLPFTYCGKADPSPDPGWDIEEFTQGTAGVPNLCQEFQERQNFGGRGRSLYLIKEKQSRCRRRANVSTGRMSDS